MAQSYLYDFPGSDEWNANTVFQGCTCKFVKQENTKLQKLNV